MSMPRKILLIRPDRLGDLILSLPVADSLKSNFPESEVHYLASRHTVPIAPMAKNVDGWIPDSDRGGKPLGPYSLARRIKFEEFDCIIELKPSWRTSIAGALSAVGLRIGTSRRLYSIFYSHRLSIHRKASGLHQTDLDLAHLRALGIQVSGLFPRLDVTERGRKSAESLLNLKDQAYVVVHPGSGGSAPNWPIASYRRLASMILERTDFKVVVTNHDNNMEAFEGCLNTGGKTDLENLAGVIGGADLFISGSTGPLHLADALGATCLSFFANRDYIGPSRWGPRRNMDRIITPGDTCRCQKADTCRCLEGLSVDSAYNKTEEILRTKADYGVNRR
jgi:heptosyltransferase-2